MKTFVIPLLCSICLLIFGSCGDSIAPVGGDLLPKIDTLDCAPPIFRPDGYPLSPPSSVHKLQYVSADGTAIAYIVNENTIKILDVKSGMTETYTPQTMMPPNVLFNGCFDLRWCPYDNNKLCFMFVTSIDTVGDGQETIYGQNLFVLYRKENKFERVNLPLISNKAGPEGLNLLGWLAGSTPSIDSLFLGYSRKSIAVRGIVVLQESKIIPVEELENFRKNGSIVNYSYSPDHKHSICLITGNRVSPRGTVIYIDGIPLQFPGDTLAQLHRASWSPDSKKVAIDLMLDRQTTPHYETVWIIDVEKWSKDHPAEVPVQKIDFQKRFCMYNFVGGPMGCEFLTSIRLVVSSWHDGDMLCPLWEITTDGRLLRQLTN